jgi:hypothetical protein
VETNPVLEPVSLNTEVVPMERRLKGTVFPIPTLPVVTKDEPPVLLRLIILAVVLPYPTTWSRVKTTGVETILFICPELFTTIWGMLEEDP